MDTKPRIDPMHHITGNHPLRPADSEDRKAPCWIVAWQQGFEQYQIAVYGKGLTAGDAEEAAQEFLRGTDYEAAPADSVFRA